MSEIEKFEGDMFWNDECTEDTVYSPEDELEECGIAHVVCFQQAARLPNFYGVMFAKQDSDDSEYRFFTTKEEAEACIDAHKVSAEQGSHETGPAPTEKAQDAL